MCVYSVTSFELRLRSIYVSIQTFFLFLKTSNILRLTHELLVPANSPKLGTISINLKVNFRQGCTVTIVVFNEKQRRNANFFKNKDTYKCDGLDRRVIQFQTTSVAEKVVQLVNCSVEDFILRPNGLRVSEKNRVRVLV